ncbi:hypothetical protein GCM10025857_32470 [Alicyclobacillus contaminans]|nr:hypothetical protein GCM10025857_32470 [Alicyclobacillus contaminans]
MKGMSIPCSNATSPRRFRAYTLQAGLLTRSENLCMPSHNLCSDRHSKSQTLLTVAGPYRIRTGFPILSEIQST